MEYYNYTTSDNPGSFFTANISSYYGTNSSNGSEFSTTNFITNFTEETTMAPTALDTPEPTEEDVLTGEFVNDKELDEEQRELFNFIDPSLRRLGDALFAINVILCILFALWTIKNRHERILRVSQWRILLVILFGCFVTNLSIIFHGYEATYRVFEDPVTGLTEVNPYIAWVDISCNLKFWVYGMGFCIYFSMILAKIKRVHMIFVQYQRDKDKTKSERTKKIGKRDVAYIVVAVLSVQLVILLVMQLAGPYRWERNNADPNYDDLINDIESANLTMADFPSLGPIRETYGLCSAKNVGRYMLGLTFVYHLILLFYALVLSFKTREIDDDFAESSYISLSVALMFEVMVVVLSLNSFFNENTNGRYVIYVLSFFLMSFIPMASLFIPKMIKLHTEKKNPDNSNLSVAFAENTDGDVIPTKSKVKKKSIPISSITHSKWDEGVDLINQLLDESNPTYNSLDDVQKDQLRDLKTLLLNRNNAGSKTNKLQYVPKDLFDTSKFKTSKRTNKLRLMKGQKINDSTRYIMKEFGGVDLGEMVDDRGSATTDDDNDFRNDFIRNDVNVEDHEKKLNQDASDGDIETNQEDFYNIHYVPKEFRSLSAEDKVAAAKLLSWKALDNWAYNIFDIAKVSKEHPLLFMGWAVLGSPHAQYAMNKECGVSDDENTANSLGGYHFVEHEDLRIPMRKLCNYLHAIEEDYSSENPYHNEIHAADVVQTLHVLIQMKGDVFPTSTIELFSILLSAAVHDVGHPGENNAFQINAKSDLALNYNDQSVLEMKHVALAFEKMFKKEDYMRGQNRRPSFINYGNDDTEFNILASAKPQVQTLIRKRMIDAVLHTDMSKHFQEVNNLKALALSGTLFNSGQEKQEEIWQVLQYMLHLADISNPAKPRDLAVLWTDRCLDEFFGQGDKERQLGLAISPNCDRNTTKRADSQIGFINFVIKPAYEVLGEIIPRVREEIIEPIILTNVQYWQEMKAKNEQNQQLQ